MRGGYAVQIRQVFGNRCNHHIPSRITDQVRLTSEGLSMINAVRLLKLIKKSKQQTPSRFLRRFGGYFCGQANHGWRRREAHVSQRRAIGWTPIRWVRFWPRAAADNTRTIRERLDSQPLAEQVATRFLPW